MNEKLGITDNISIRMNDVGVVNEAPPADFLRVKGHIQAVVFGANGEVKERRDIPIPNMIVTNGKYGIADQILASPTLTKPTHMAIGTGAVAPALGDTALGGEIGTRQTFSSLTRSTNVLTFVASFGAGIGTGAITEAGILNAVTVGNLYSRVTFSVINKGASDTLQLTWTWTIG